MKVFILAAGVGSRLGELTQNTPKALVKVGATTMLEHTLFTLRSAGFEDFVINIHHHGDQIIDFLATKDDLGVKISDEREMLLDTGGAIKHAKDLLGSKPFLVHNVDIYTNLDYKWFVQRALDNAHEPNYLATLLVSDRKTERYLLFDNDNKLVGWTNLKTGEVKSPYPDLDISKCNKLAFSGIHSLSPKVYSLMESFPDKFSIIDFYLSVCKDFTIKGEVYPDLKLFDLGTVDKIQTYLNSK